MFAAVLGYVTGNWAVSFVIGVVGQGLSHIVRTRMWQARFARLSASLHEIEEIATELEFQLLSQRIEQTPQEAQ